MWSTFPKFNIQMVTASLRLRHSIWSGGLRETGWFTVPTLSYMATFWTTRCQCQILYCVLLSRGISRKNTTPQTADSINSHRSIISCEPRCFVLLRTSVLVLPLLCAKYICSRYLNFKSRRDEDEDGISNPTEGRKPRQEKRDRPTAWGDRLCALWWKLRETRVKWDEAGAHRMGITLFLNINSKSI